MDEKNQAETNMTDIEWITEVVKLELPKEFKRKASLRKQLNDWGDTIKTASTELSIQNCIKNIEKLNYEHVEASARLSVWMQIANGLKIEVDEK